MNDPSKKRPVPPEPATPNERRRIGEVVHDERGNARVNWHDAPADYERPVLEVLGESGLTLKSEDLCDPYANHRPQTSGTANSPRRDLRKLSEWIKLMREIEERKRNGGGEQ